MKHFRFEYTLATTLVIIFVASFSLGLVVSVNLPDMGRIFGLPIKAILAFLIPVLSMVFGKSRYKKTGEALIKDDELELNLDGTNYIIPFEDIESYKIEYGNGVILALNLHSQPRIKISANDKFSKSELLYDFCKELERSVIEYGKITNSPVKRQPSFFENKWVTGILIFLTFLFFVMLFRAAALHKDFQRPAFAGFSALGMLWSAWLMSWIRKNRL